MNDYYDNMTPINAKILVRIRSNPLVKDKFNETEQSVRRADNLDASSITPSKNNSINLSKSNIKSGASQKRGSKSPVNNKRSKIILII